MSPPTAGSPQYLRNAHIIDDMIKLTFFIFKNSVRLILLCLRLGLYNFLWKNVYWFVLLFVQLSLPNRVNIYTFSLIYSKMLCFSRTKYQKDFIDTKPF